MKTIILILAVLLTANIYAQKQDLSNLPLRKTIDYEKYRIEIAKADSIGRLLPYKALPEFGTDTTAFFYYNFNLRAVHYKGKTIGDVLKDIPMQPTSASMSPSMQTGYYGGIDIYFDNSTFDERLSYTSQSIKRRGLYIYIYIAIC